MNALIETGNEYSGAMTPLLRRLLNDPLLSRGRGALVMSQRKRERLMVKNQERQDYLKEHPWWGEIQGWEREVIRRIVFGLEKIGRKVEAERLHWFLFTIGDFLGKEPIWPILSHLLEGGVFDFEGTQFSGDRPNTKQLPSVALLPFLAPYVPENLREGRLFTIGALLTAYDRAQDLIRSALKEQDSVSKESPSVPPSQISQIPGVS
jgi:hypothetical protein